MSQNENKTDMSKAAYIPKTSPAIGSHIGHVVAVMSGKGGVGKSFISSYLATALRRKGYKVGVLDADVTGPSIPYCFGVTGPTYSENGLILPVISKTGIEIMSSNLLLDNPEDPIVWRGAMISTLIEQFYSEVKWDCDYLIIDLAPGTGDISLTVFQKIRLSSAVLVTSPQSMVNMVVEKSAKMAEMLSVPLLSLVENMAYVKCPHCGERIDIYGKQDTEIGKRHGIPVFDEVPFDGAIAKAMDEHKVEELEIPYLDSTVNAIIRSSNDEADKNQ